ncbi:MAG: GNAT family N-acetyltransferase [Marinilabiliaceae bacterium]|nr:GNAT family N-acetyltransferase [Marinilabiliaceae bacterium]
MRVIDLKEEYKPIYFNCLEDWSDEMKEAGTHKECWCNKMENKGLGVKLALDDADQVGGMIQYIPIEYAIAEGKDLYFINCIWVHGYKKGKGNFQKQGMGTALLSAAEEDVKARGAKGIVAWGMPLPVWMKASWYKKQGYRKADKTPGIFGPVLLWKPFTRDALPPRWIHQKKKPDLIPGRVVVSSFINGWCPVQSIVTERAKRVASEFGHQVVYKEYNTSDRDVMIEWGLSDALFIDDKKISNGPPLSYDKIRKRVARKVKKISAV